MEKIRGFIKHIAKIILRRDFWAHKQINLKTKWYGRKNLGFFVYDQYLNSESIVYSFGIGEDISFDEELIKKFNCTVFGFDPTPKTIEFIRRKRISSKFIFEPVGVFSFDGNINFYFPKNPDHVSCTTSEIWEGKTENHFVKVPVKKFSQISNELGHSKIDILKLDIEGSEYEVLDDILHSNISIGQILIEFHHRFPKVGIAKTKRAIAQLNQYGYKIAAISSTYEEFTFVKL